MNEKPVYLEEKRKEGGKKKSSITYRNFKDDWWFV